MREFSRVSSNWRSQQVAEEYLEQFKIPVLADIDTRALVRHLRDHGVMRGVISTIESDAEKLVAKARSIPKMDGTDLAKVVTHEASVRVGSRRALARADRSGRSERRAGALSCGRLRLRHQAEHSAQAARRGLQGDGRPGADSGGRCARAEAHGVFLSNGPGDPEPVHYAVDTIRRLMGRAADLRHLPRTPADRASRSAARPSN